MLKSILSFESLTYLHPFTCPILMTPHSSSRKWYYGKNPPNNNMMDDVLVHGKSMADLYKLTIIHTQIRIVLKAAR